MNLFGWKIIPHIGTWCDIHEFWELIGHKLNFDKNLSISDIKRLLSTLTVILLKS